jgi:putative endonuclease
VYLLVHVEEYSDIKEAIAREKQLKHWKREWKLDLIEKTNSEWLDLADSKREG